MQRRNVIVLSIFAVFYLGFGTWLTFNQESIVYYPNEQDFYDCPALAVASAGQHNGTRMYVYRPDLPVVIFYHGNAGSACDRAFIANLFSQAGYGYILVEYAGYSNDSLQPTHNRIKQDVEQVIDYLAQNNIEPTVIAGESIGTGVATYHTTLAPAHRLLLLSPFTDLAAVAREQFWFYPTRWLVDNAFDNVAALQGYAGDTLIIHGDNDPIISYRLGQQLYETLSGQKSFTTIENAGHNDLFAYEETHDAVYDFFSQE